MTGSTSVGCSIFIVVILVAVTIPLSKFSANRIKMLMAVSVKETSLILLEGTPKDINVDAITQELLKVGFIA